MLPYLPLQVAYRRAKGFKFRKLHFLVVVEVIEVIASLEVIDVCYVDVLLVARYRL